MADGDAPKGDYASVPLNAEGRKMADGWDLTADNASGNQCRAFGAAAIMRVPTRVRISWQDDSTLKLETDAGQQTRLFRFASPTPSGVLPPPPPAGARSWQESPPLSGSGSRRHAGWASAAGARCPAEASEWSRAICVRATSERMGFPTVRMRSSRRPSIGMTSRTATRITVTVIVEDSEVSHAAVHHELILQA